MQKRFLPALFAAAFLLIVIDYGCTKIDTTTLGSDLLAIDNVTTFADTLDVQVTQGIFNNDSTLIDKTDNMVFGKLADPLFGGTDAALYVQFKPTFYPFYFGDAGDKVYPSQSPDAHFDSAFVCLSYKGTYGDTIGGTVIPQTIEVRQIQDNDFRINTDTLRKLTYARPNAPGSAIGTATITPQIAVRPHRVGHGADSAVTNQIRIKLDDTWARTLYNTLDSTTIQPNNGLNNDSMFRKNLHGLEIRISSGSPGARTLYYVNLAETNSRLEFQYSKVTAAGVKSSENVKSFQFYPVASGSIRSSSVQNSVIRTYSSNVTTAAATINPADVFITGNPGTYANIKIPALTGYSNRIVHRAYLVAEQDPFDPVTDGQLQAPPYLYLDLKDTVTAVPQRYKPLYYDLNSVLPYNPDVTAVNGLYHPYPFANVDISTFGGVALQRFEPSGLPFIRYEMNVTRYVQHIVSNGLHNYDMRLYSPYSFYYPQYLGNQYVIPYFNPVTYGRVRLASGRAANAGQHHMRLVVVYSKV